MISALPASLERDIAQAVADAARADAARVRRPTNATADFFVPRALIRVPPPTSGGMGWLPRLLIVSGLALVVRGFLIKRGRR